VSNFDLDRSPESSQLPISFVWGDAKPLKLPFEGLGDLSTIVTLMPIGALGGDLPGNLSNLADPLLKREHNDEAFTSRNRLWHGAKAVAHHAPPPVDI